MKDTRTLRCLAKTEGPKGWWTFWKHCSQSLSSHPTETQAQVALAAVQLLQGSEHAHNERQYAQIRRSDR